MSSSIYRISRLLPRSANTFLSGGNPAASRRLCRLAPLVLALATAGCGGGSSTSSSSTAPAGLQPPAAAAAINDYVGTSPLDVNAAGASPIGETYKGNGLWSVSIDHTVSPSIFNAVDVTTNSNNTDSTGDLAGGNVAGTAQLTAGFLNLNQTNDPGNPNTQAGFALEIPGRAALMRQGDNTMPVIALAPTGCPGINGNTKFNFVALPTATWAWDTDPAYGSLLIASSGTTWNFTSFQQSTLAGTVAPNSGVALPSGVCAPSALGTSVYVPTDVAQPLPKTVAIGPSGFYIADQGAGSGGNNNFPGEIGVIQPSAALNTSSVVSHQYLGFIFEAGADAVLPVVETQLAGFSASTPSGQLVGGGFPINPITLNDDPTQPAATNLVIDLGKQDPSNNGVYPNATISNSPSVYQAAAVVGTLEGKYAIFIIGYDSDNALPLGIYLFQQ